MTAVMTESAPASAPVFPELPLNVLFDSALNPRRRFDEAKVAELAASMRVHGLIEPIVVRPRVAGGFELIAGHYRVRAAQLAEMKTLPYVQRNLSDRDALEVMLIENHQRSDVHPLDEADGFARLMELDGAYGVDAIAAKVGVSPSYVYKRLKLRALIPAAREHFERDEITAAHAEILATLTPEHQNQALPECFYSIFRRVDADPKAPRQDVQPVAKLRAWVQDHVKLVPTDEHVAHYFPEIHEVVSEAANDPARATLLALSESHMPGPVLGKNHGALPARSWVEIVRGRKRCANARQGIVVHGGPQRVITVCATKGCPTHFPTPKKSAGGKPFAAADDRLRREKEAREARWKREEEQRQAWQAFVPTAMAAFADHVRDHKMTGELLRQALAEGTHADVHDIEQIIGGRISDANVGQACAVACVDPWTRERFLKSVKAFGFNLGAIEQKHKAEKKAAEKAAQKAVTKAAKTQKAAKSRKGARS